jgi:FKBP-type peptidyl-prolyl cis-trans isomerase/predicted  nucleic acid-binding Zn-ribbon protein
VPVFKHFWQNLILRLKPRVHPSAGEFEQELSAARQDREGLLGQLTGLQAEVERGLSTASQAQQRLLGQLNHLRAEVKQDLSAAGLERQTLSGELASLRSEVEHGLSVTREEQQGLHGQLTGLRAEIEHGLSAVSEERQGLLGQLSGLQSEVEHGLSAVREEQHVLLGRLTSLQSDYERELSATRLEKQSLLGLVSGLQDDLERVRSRDEQLRAELQQRFDQLQAERDVANQEVMVLRTSLADASLRQQATDTRVDSLETGLKEQQQAHDAVLQQALVRERRQARRLTAALTVAIAAFVLGIVGSAINFWEVHNTARLLGEVSQGIRDIRYTLEGKTGGNMQSPVEVTPAAPVSEREQPAATPPEALSEQSKKADMAQGLSATELPEPDFVANKSLPLEGRTFNSRQDMRAFFEENALQPGVLSTPGGLQYRELIAGTGKSPGNDDKVVIEYRAFRPDGTELDNSFKKELPSSFIVNEAIPALKEALPRMREGAQWELYVPPELAYKGIRKRGPRGFEPLVLTVELLSVTAAEKGADR